MNVILNKDDKARTILGPVFFMEEQHMENNIMFCDQLSYLNQLKNNQLISMSEYKTIKDYIMKKYKIGIHQFEM